MAEKKTISIDVKNMAGEKVGTMSLKTEVFGVEMNKQAVHDAICVYNANLRQATAKTKTRSEVSGGGKKPWRQKGTGRARAGSTRSPIWVGGGKVATPTGNQNFKLSQNKKEHALALKSVLSAKVKDGLIVVDEWKLEGMKTKNFAEILKALKADKKVLVVLDNDDANVIASARNLKNVGVTGDNNVAVYDLVYFDQVIMSKKSLKNIEEAIK